MHVNGTRIFQALGLLFTGFLLGTISILSYAGVSAKQFFSLSFWEHTGAHKDQIAAGACDPKTKGDDIFFLTCGGVY